MTVTITRTSVTRYDVHVDSRWVGAGNTLSAAKRIAARHHTRLRWRRVQGRWVGRPPRQHPDLTGRTHGRRATYNAGCRCRACTAADTNARARRRGNVPPGEKLTA